MNTNLLAAIVITITTNWTEIGTFSDTRGNSFQIFSGQIVTNTVGHMEFDGQEVNHTFKAVAGPVLTQHMAVLHGTPVGGIKPAYVSFTLPEIEVPTNRLRIPKIMGSSLPTIPSNHP